jgi:hypothetical protein
MGSIWIKMYDPSPLEKIHYTISYVCNTNMLVTKPEALLLLLLHTKLSVIVNKIKFSFKEVCGWYMVIVKKEIKFIRQFLVQGTQIFQKSRRSLKIVGATRVT